jgi:hypothetical protein
MPFDYQPIREEQLRNAFHRRRRAGLNGFQDVEAFLEWYYQQPLRCHYCGLPEHVCQEAVMRGLLSSKRFPVNGVIGQGTNRGVWLEVDRLQPQLPYSSENCVLSCYFCNNDKSDVFTGAQYLTFLQNRAAFIDQLVQDNPE